MPGPDRNLLRLSARLRHAIRAELLSRGVAVPALRPPAPPSACQGCGGRELRVTWHEQHGGRKVIRGDCRACSRFVAFLPQTPGNVSLADAAASAAGFIG
jgi:hypothetical protein